MKKLVNIAGVFSILLGLFSGILMLLSLYAIIFQKNPSYDVYYFLDLIGYTTAYLTFTVITFISSYLLFKMGEDKIKEKQIALSWVAPLLSAIIMIIGLTIEFIFRPDDEGLIILVIVTAIGSGTLPVISFILLGLDYFKIKIPNWILNGLIALSSLIFLVAGFCLSYILYVFSN